MDYETLVKASDAFQNQTVKVDEPRSVVLPTPYVLPPQTYTPYPLKHTHPTPSNTYQHVYPYPYPTLPHKPYVIIPESIG